MRPIPPTAPFAAALLAVLALAGPSAAQAPPASDTVYVESSGDRSAFAAGALEWLVPTAGYAYAGNWSRGVPPALIRIVGVGLFLEDQFTIFGDPPPCDGQCLVGAVMAVGGTVWSIVGAGRTATRQNERRRAERAGLPVQVYPRVGSEGVGIGLRLAIP